MWRVGRRVPLNVYEDDRPICQCHTAADAARIVAGMNSVLRQPVREETDPANPEPIGVSIQDLELTRRAHNALHWATYNKLRRRNYDFQGIDLEADAIELLNLEAPGKIMNLGVLSFIDVLRSLMLHGVTPKSILMSQTWREIPKLWRRRIVAVLPDLAVDL